MQPQVQIHGKCDTKFHRVREFFQEHFEQDREIGAAVAVTIDGKPIVNLWAGYADKDRTIPWQEDTLVNVFSSTKGITAICIHRLVDQGVLDLDQRVAHYWPEFARNGKEEITLRQILNHQAGVPAITDPLPSEAVFDWPTMTQAIAVQPPWWPPGTKHGYHARTYGWLTGEIVQRTIGKTLGTYLHEEITGPLGVDFHIGLEDVHHKRVAYVTRMPPPPPGVEPNLGRVMLTQPDDVTTKAFNNPALYKIHDAFNTGQWRRMELPSSNGHGTALSIARLYGALACGGTIDGIRVLTPHSIEAARTEQSNGYDQVLKTQTRFALGFMMPIPGNTMGPNSQAFGHPGMGGSLGFADPEARVGFGYTMNRSQGYILIDDRPAALIEALYDVLN